jgi:hypothetical protein
MPDEILGLRIERYRGSAGLYYAVSPDMPGLLVAEATEEERERQIPLQIEALRQAQVPSDRDDRQKAIVDWGVAAFGIEHMTSLPQRALRFLEEAIEAYQAAGADAAMAHKLVDFVFSRPPGEIGQELGGCGVTLLALANAAGLSADSEEAREVARVLAKPPSHFAERNRQKNDAGVDVTGEAAGAYPVAAE